MENMARGLFVCGSGVLQWSSVPAADERFVPPSPSCTLSRLLTVAACLVHNACSLHHLRVQSG